MLNDTSNDSWIPISNLSKLSFVCLGSTTDSYFQNALDLYQQFLDLSGQKGQLFIAHIESETNKVIKHTYNGDGSAILTAAQWKNDIIPHIIEEVCESNYKPFEAVLYCGEYHKLESPITIWPTPMVCYWLHSIFTFHIDNTYDCEYNIYFISSRTKMKKKGTK